MHSVTPWADEDDHVPDGGSAEGAAPLAMDLDDELPPEPGEADAAPAAPSAETPVAAAPAQRPPKSAEAAPRRSRGDRTRRGKRSSIDKYRDLVGVMTDAEVAEKAGVTSSAVAQYRTRRGIAAALPQGSTRRAQRLREESERRAPSVPPAAPPRSAPRAEARPVRPPKASAAGTPYAWRIALSLRGQVTERVVVAEDAIEACEVASRHGEVVSATRLCPAL